MLDEDGFTLRLSGAKAGLAKREAGLHKFVTLSRNGKKHTSFCKIEFWSHQPTAPVSLLESDIDFKSQKASGPGGQHVNKTESAIRATHKPSGFSVLCSAERSQAENKRIAVAWLSAKLQEKSQLEVKKGKQSAWRISARLGAGEAARSYWMDENRCVDNQTGQRMSLSDIMAGGCSQMWE